MAIAPAVTQQILSHLEQDRASNYYRLQYYLKSILNRRAVDIVLDNQTTISLSPQEAWDIIAPWAASAEVGLPVEKRGSLKTMAGRLLSYIEINIVEASAAAAASYYSHLEQAQNPLPIISPTTPELDSYTKAAALRQQLFSAVNTKFLGGLTTKLEQTRYLQRIPDVRTRSLVAAFLAGNSASLRSYTLDKTDTSDLPTRLNQLLLARAGDQHVNEAIHLAYSAEVEPELKEISETINTHITQVYGTDNTTFLADQASLRTLSALSPTLDDIGVLVQHLSPHATPAEQSALTQALRSQIVSSARAQHQSGQTLLTRAFRQAGLAGDPTALSSLSPILEELVVSTRQGLLDTQVFDRDPRLLATYSLAAQTGVSPTIPWLKPKDLQAVQTKLLSGTNFTDPQAALTAELGSATPNLTRVSELKNFLSLKNQHRDYQARLSDSPLLATQDLLARTSGNWTAFRQPADRIMRKVWRGIDKVDDVLNWPTRKLSEEIDKLVDKTTITVKLRNGKKLAIPLLSPVNFVYNQWTNLQKGLALRVFRWSHKLALSGKWYSAPLRQVADFSRAFFKADANWGHASFLFVERKWGNLLNWTAKKVFKQETFTALKASIGASIKTFAMKIAPALTSKVLAIVADLGLSATGVGLILVGAQILWEAGKFLFHKLRDFITNAGGFRDKVLNWLPIAVGAAASWLIALPAIVLGAAAAFLSGALAALAALFTSLAPLFILALALAGGLLAGTALLYQISIKTIPDLDSKAAQIFSSLVCDQSGQSGSSPIANCASCLVEYLTDCYSQEVTDSDFATTGIGCLIAKSIAPDVASIIEQSATKYTYLQCVGFAQASVACGGGSLAGNNACGYINNAPSGWTYVKGTAGAKSGNLCMIASSGTCSDGAPGHIFVVGQEDCGALICAIDANKVCAGCVSAETRIPAGEVAGCLTPN